MIPAYFIDESEYQTIFDGLEVKEEPRPEIPPEVWNETKPDPEKCRQATRALCG